MLKKKRLAKGRKKDKMHSTSLNAPEEASHHESETEAFEVESENSEPMENSSGSAKRRHSTKHDGDDYSEQVDEGKAGYDPAAYTLLHELEVEWPSLSFDWLRSNYIPVSYPYEGYIVIGTQSAQGKANYLRTMKVENLHRTYEPPEENDPDEDWRRGKWVSDLLDEQEEDGDFDLDAELGLKEPATENLGYLEVGKSSINRIRTNPHSSLLAAWAGNVIYICDCKEDDRFALHQESSIECGKEDGWALHWSPLTNCNLTLVAGNEDGNVTFIPDVARSETRQTAVLEYSVQDIQLSPTEPSVFIAGGGDGNMSVFDTRSGMKPQLRWNSSHPSKVDVNAIAWNPTPSSGQFICTGSDDGVLKVWDLRSVSAHSSDAVVKEITGYHKSPLNAIQWCPGSESVCIACSDTETSIYDFSIERDFQEEMKMKSGKKSSSREYVEELQQLIPTEVLFEHGGLNYAKDVRFHPQIPGLIGITHFDGYQLFRPINWKSLYD
ncbi:transducin family protein / WD-40 repeat family protein [Perkinsela sp. CCAP 1560/4]|nr:transducin family protein / WD-40 repeat family protein [Perkinsela sp. CCAP 1560/4]|eukprot:KNH08702.1 transducin family protein / WD-40 repeat family protein [Perkinsela sp. CCAP 1560/4]